MSDSEIRILTDLDPSGPRTHVQIRIPAPVLDDEMLVALEQKIRERLARAFVRRNLGLEI